ncbi:MAG TPA: hypothetical protein VEQ34_01915, partial [Pyrinomonadaceae bacterium]|nr:hypothetical protein [Pyrinomonadaceae bacterium]
PLENFYLELGAYKINRDKSDKRRWLETPLVPQFKAAIQNSEQSIGSLNVAETSIPSHNVTHYY